MRVISLNIGQPERLVYFGQETLTGGRKQPVAQAHLGWTHFDGDQQADLVNHGGPEKAACVYSFEHYPYWAETLGEALTPGAFSENLTIAGLQEAEVHVGDIFQLGEARVQISQPRKPCSKLAGKHQRKTLPDLIQANGFSGFYLRVLQEGQVRVEDAFTRVEAHPLGVTVAFANQVMYRQRAERADLERVLAVDALSEAWRSSLSRRRQANGLK